MTNQEFERLAAAKIFKARTSIMQTGKRKFWAVLLANTRPAPCWKIPTMGTDSKTHFYNPRFICELPQDEVEGTCVHESEHDARHHSTRRKGRDPVRWNKACDYAINGHIIAEGFKLPKGILFRQDLVDLSAEEIYRILEKEEQEQEQNQPDTDPGQDDESEGDDESESNTEGDDESEPESPDDQGDDGESESEDEGDDQGENGQGGDSTEGDDESDDEGEGEGEAGDGEGEAGDGEGDDSTEGESSEGEGEGESSEPTSCGEGGCGEVFDAPGTESEQADDDAKWEVIARQAAAMARKAGTLPGYWEAEIEQRATPTEDWRTVLREWIDAGVNVIQTFNRPNRRFAHQPYVLPGNQRDGINKVVFQLDTSGSMYSYHRNALVANEIQAAMDAGLISEAVVIQVDNRIIEDNIARYFPGDTIDLTPKGFGGTDMAPGFAWVEENEPDASLIVCLTDLEIPDPGPQPSQPVLWCAYGPPSLYQHKPAWGKVLDVGSNV